MVQERPARHFEIAIENTVGRRKKSRPGGNKGTGEQSKKITRVGIGEAEKRREKQSSAIYSQLVFQAELGYLRPNIAGEALSET